MSKRSEHPPLSELEAKLVAACIAVWEAQAPARQRERIARGLEWARYQKALRQKEPTS
jgi:hypothetical protein